MQLKIVREPRLNLIDEPRTGGWTVKQIYDQFKQPTIAGKIVIPSFQRKFIWDTERQQKLIDSICRGLFIPSILVNRTTNFEYEIIDGQQRIMSIINFIDNIISINLDGSSYHFANLPSHWKNAFHARVPFSYSLYQNLSQPHKQLMFYRIQRGMTLSFGEIIHGIDSSPLILALNETFNCLENDDIEKVVHGKTTRMNHYRYSVSLYIDINNINLWSEDETIDFIAKHEQINRNSIHIISSCFRYLIAYPILKPKSNSLRDLAICHFIIICRIIRHIGNISSEAISAIRGIKTNSGGLCIANLRKFNHILSHLNIPQY